MAHYTRRLGFVEEYKMKGLCISCMKRGIQTFIETEKVDSKGRTIIVRTCGNHQGWSNRHESK